MNPTLAWLTQPLPLALFAIGLFSLRVIMIARHLKSSGVRPTLADRRARQASKAALEAPKEALASARREGRLAIEDARQMLHASHAPGKRWQAALPSDREKTTRSLEAARGLSRTALAEARTQDAFVAARRLLEDSRPRAPVQM